ncbi:MAG: zinc metallopeptidase, partial [Paludibacteraceae bacterium]|nr:zinc metallopeptidase [Paludibacteraceae bacterium]
YDCANIAAAAVAAHECGHAVQHARGYAFLKMRSAMVPAVSFSSKYVSWILLGGIIFINSFPQLMLIGICLFALTTLFSFVTLPVEIDASSRALAWLKNSGVSSFSNHQMAVKALRSAAYTYVVAALSSLATLLYYVIIYLGRRD